MSIHLYKNWFTQPSRLNHNFEGKHLSNILIIMAFTTHLGRIKINFQNKIILPLPLKNPPHKLLKTILLLLGLNRQPKPKIKNVSNV